MKSNKFLRRKNKRKSRYRKGGLRTTTYILGAKCKDGVVLVGDRKVTGGAEPYSDKIKKTPKIKFVIFAAAGVPSLFEEFLEELPRRVIRSINYIEEQNEKLPESCHYKYDNYNFRQDCVILLKEMKKTYSEIEEIEDYESALQVLFAISEVRNQKIRQRLYFTDLLACYPIPVDRKAVAIGQSFLADIFLKAWNPEWTMKDTARLGSFIIKYIEKEKLSPNDGVGVGDLQPQVWFFANNKPEPREITGGELDNLLKGINDEVEKKIKGIGSRSAFLRL